MVVRYGQKGYVGLSMSENAKAAYEDGEMPYSKWTKARMIAAIKDCCYDNDLKFDETIVHAMKRDDLFSEAMEYRAWHHTGKFAQQTDFYGVNEDWVLETFPPIDQE